MSMIEKVAFDATKEIVVAAMPTLTRHMYDEIGIETGEFFQEIYKKVLEVAKDIKE